MRSSDWSSDVCSSDLTRGDPCAMALRKISGIRERAARRHGQDRFAVARMDSQRVAPRSAMPPLAYRIDLRAVLDRERSAERRGGEEYFSTSRSGWAPFH